MKMNKVTTRCIFWSAILICLDCRPPMRNLGLQYQKLFESTNCHWDQLDISYSKNDTEDKNSQQSISLPMQLCFNNELITLNKMTYSLCDEILSILYDIHCTLLTKLENSSLVMKGWNESTDICQSFESAEFIKPDSSYYTSTSLKIKDFCEFACVKKNKDLCKVLLWEQEIKHLYVVQLENQKSSSRIADMQNNKTFSTSTEHYLKNQTEFKLGENAEMNTVNPQNYIKKSKFENISSVSNKSMNKFKSNLPVTSDNSRENIVTTNQSYVLNDLKNPPNDVQELSNVKIGKSLNTTSPTTNVKEVLHKEQPDEPVDNLDNSTYLNNDLQANSDNADSNGLTSKETKNNLIYEKTINDSIVSNPSLNSEVGNKNQSSTSKSVLTDLVSDEELTDNNKDTKINFDDLNDRQSLKEMNVNNSSSSNSQSINMEQAVENAFSGANQSVDEMFPQSQKVQVEETATMPVFIPTSSDDAGIETSIDDESTFFSKFDHSASNEIEPKKPDISVLSKFTVDNILSSDEDIFHDHQNSDFIFYFVLSSLTIIILYVILHNKQKIIALIIEGCQERRRRPHGVSYRKLDTN